MSHHPPKVSGHGLFNIFQDHVIKMPYDRQEPVMVSYYPVTFSGHRHSGSGQLVCQATSKDHGIKVSCDFMGGSSL